MDRKGITRVRKTYFLSLVLAMVILITVTGSTEANLVINGGFETGNETGWSTFASPSLNFTHNVVSPGFNSSWAGYMYFDVSFQDGYSQFCGCYQLVNFDIRPEELLYINLDVKTENVDYYASLNARIDFYSAETPASTEEFISTVMIFDVPIEENINWTHYFKNAYVPLEAKSFEVVLWATAPALQFSTAELYFDNVYVDYQPVPEPSSLMFLGTGLVGLFGVIRKKKKNGKIT